MAHLDVFERGIPPQVPMIGNWGLAPNQTWQGKSPMEWWIFIATHGWEIHLAAKLNGGFKLGKSLNYCCIAGAFSDHGTGYRRFMGIGMSTSQCGNKNWLVVWNMNFMTFHILGISSYPYFSEG